LEDVSHIFREAGGTWKSGRYTGSGDRERAETLLEESIDLGGDAARREAGNYEILGGMLD
jgi:hypothetical protein